MSANLDQVTQALRESVLAGDYEPGTALREVAVASVLGVSRTLARLAMGALEREGLLTHAPNRGFRVRLFTVDEIADAIEVRGELEALAARQAAERGLSGKLSKRLGEILDDARDIMEREAFNEIEGRIRWIELNAAFHAAIVEGAGNTPLVSAIGHVCRIPMAGPKAIVFNTTLADHGLAQVRAAHEDHEQILDAIQNRQGTRAAALIREHAYRSSRHKRQNFEDMERARSTPVPPGLALIRRPDVA